MDWTQEAIRNLQSLFNKKFMEMQLARKTDRRNLSAIWNRYIANYGVRIVFDFRENTRKPRRATSSVTSMQQHYAKLDDTLSNFISVINHNNIDVVGSLVLKNPDRHTQYLLIKRDMAERILVLGML